ncbi:YgjV family protein [Lewinella sp. IMCC34183]|uniref:YgjV family protein n=1 Tax=Lewinella sp. IMCC34183 TaxID=2248762 RepID=UPI000E264649|nr:YgjV family protein [Lewinella sp. IMCC34183]
MHELTELLGYLAIAAGFFAITRKAMNGFRLWHLLSNFLYIFYGILLASGPLIISGVIFVLVHGYHLQRAGCFTVRRPRRPRGA